LKLVLIEWEDPCSSSPMWESRVDIKNLDTTSCISVGIVLSETREDISLGLSRNVRNYAQAIIIPKKSIKRIRQLKISERRE